MPSAKDLFMRYTPVAAAVALLAAVVSSAGNSAAPETLSPRAAALVAQGRTALAEGNVEAAVDAYEAALVVQPGSVSVLLGLADATRRTGMQGKALHYYREALQTDPKNLTAIAGEGTALAEKGAIEKARLNLAQLERLCGADCGATRELNAAIAKGPAQRVVSAEAVTPAPVVSDN